MSGVVRRALHAVDQTAVVTLPTQNILFTSKTLLPENIDCCWIGYTPPTNRFSAPLPPPSPADVAEIERILMEAALSREQPGQHGILTSHPTESPLSGAASFRVSQFSTSSSSNPHSTPSEPKSASTQHISSIDDNRPVKSNTLPFTMFSEPLELPQTVPGQDGKPWEEAVQEFILSHQHDVYTPPAPEKKRPKSKSAKTRAPIPSMPRLIYLNKTLTNQLAILSELLKTSNDEKHYKTIQMTRTSDTLTAKAKRNQSKVAGEAIIRPWDAHAGSFEITPAMRERSYDLYPPSVIVSPFTPRFSPPLGEVELQQMRSLPDFFGPPSSDVYPVDISALEPLPPQTFIAIEPGLSVPSPILSQVYASATLADPAAMFDAFVEAHKSGPKKSREECELTRNALLSLSVDLLNQLQYAMAAYYHRQVTGHALFPLPEVAAFYGFKPSLCGTKLYLRRHVERNIPYGSAIFRLLHDPASMENNAFAAFKTPYTILTAPVGKLAFTALDFFHAYDHSETVSVARSGYVNTLQHDTSVVRRSFNKGLWIHDVIPWLAQLTVERLMQYERRKTQEMETLLSGEPIVQNVRVNYYRTSIYQKRRRVIERLAKVELQMREHARLALLGLARETSNDDDGIQGYDDLKDLEDLSFLNLNAEGVDVATSDFDDKFSDAQSEIEIEQSLRDALGSPTQVKAVQAATKSGNELKEVGKTQPRARAKSKPTAAT